MKFDMRILALVGGILFMAFWIFSTYRGSQLAEGGEKKRPQGKGKIMGGFKRMLSGSKQEVTTGPPEEKKKVGDVVITRTKDSPWRGVKRA